MPFCNECGKEYPEGAKFCQECGRKVVKDEDDSTSPTNQDILESDKRIETTKKKPGSLFYILGVSVIIISLFFIFSDGGEDESNASSDNVQSARVSLNTPEEKITYSVNKAIGDTTNSDHDRIISIETGDTITLTLAADDNLTLSMRKGSILSSSKKVYEEIWRKHYIDWEYFRIVWQGELIDTYGNEFMDDILILRLSRDHARNIKWDTITTEGFEQLTFEWMHHEFY